MGFNVGGSLQLNTVRTENAIAKKIDSWFITGPYVSGSPGYITTNTAGDGINTFSKLSLLEGGDNQSPYSVNIYVYGRDRTTDGWIQVYTATLEGRGSRELNISIAPRKYIYCQLVGTTSTGFLRGLVLP